MATMKCEIPNTPNNRAAIKKLKEVLSGTTFTLYVQDSKGKVMPVMDVAKHPDCPEELFSMILNLIINTKYYGIDGSEYYGYNI